MSIHLQPSTRRYLRLSLAAVTVLIVAAGCGRYVPTPPPKAETYASYRIGAPDQLIVTILPDPKIEESVRVRPDGMITVQLIGDVPAGGRTAEEVAADVEKRISRFKRGARATVSVAQAHSTSITVFGEVRAPQAFALTKSTRVAEALATVGGPTLMAKKRDVRVIRHGGGETVVYDVDLNAIMGGDLSTNLVLLPGDIIYVPPTIMARIGYVVNQMLFPFQPFLGVAMGVAANAISGF